MLEKKTIKILDIYLDSENPRHDPITDREAIIAHLLKKEKVRAIARHISLNGPSPLETPAVYKDKAGHYVVLEGNRRVCALTLLNDPALSPSADLTYFQNLKNTSTLVPKKIECVVFKTRESANKWIVLRHNGEQDGVGTRTWDATQKTRNNMRNNKRDENALAQSLLDYAVEHGFMPADREDKILTTASRYLGNPYFRNILGIVTGRSEKNVIIRVPYIEFDRVLERFCQDLLNPASGVNSRTKREDWMDYAKRLASEGVAPKSIVSDQNLSDRTEYHEQSSESASPYTNSNEENANGNTPRPDELEGNNPVNEKESEEEKTGERNNQSPDKRKFIVDSKFKISIHNNILKRVFDELRSEPLIGDTPKPLAASLLCRAFLENLYQLYLEKLTGTHKEQKTHQLMLAIIEHLEKEKTNLTQPEKNALAAFKRIPSSESHCFSPKVLGANAHAGYYPDPVQLKREWDNISAILIYMLKRI